MGFLVERKPPTLLNTCQVYTDEDHLYNLKFGTGNRSRTCTHEALEPKSSVSTNSTIPALVLRVGFEPTLYRSLVYRLLPIGLPEQERRSMLVDGRA